MFQDNAGGYDEYTGKVGSDGDEAGDETNKKNLSSTNSVKKRFFVALPPKK